MRLTKTPLWASPGCFRGILQPRGARGAWYVQSINLGREPEPIDGKELG